MWKTQESSQAINNPLRQTHYKMSCVRNQSGPVHRAEEVEDPGGRHSSERVTVQDLKSLSFPKSMLKKTRVESGTQKMYGENAHTLSLSLVEPVPHFCRSGILSMS